MDDSNLYITLSIRDINLYFDALISITLYLISFRAFFTIINRGAKPGYVKSGF